MTPPSQLPDTDETAVFAVLNEIGIIGQLAGTALRRALPGDMTMAQFSVLNHFSRLGAPETPAHLAAAFQVTKGAMTNTLKRLQAKRYVTLRIDPADRRRKIVMATPAGLKVHKAALDALHPLLLQAAEAMDGAAFRAALPFLRDLRTHLDQARDPQDFPDS